MISSRKELLFYIAADRIIANKTARRRFKEWLKSLILPNYILMYLRSMRYVAYFNNTSERYYIFVFKRLFHKWRYEHLGVKLGFTIGFNSFGYGLFIPHYGTIVVNNSTVAGNYCVLHTSTCIAGSGIIIGDALYLSTGALIMGADVKLGDNVSVASNSLVNKSIPSSNILLMGSPTNTTRGSKAWYERDGEQYKKRIEEIERIKRNMGIYSIDI